MKMLFLMSPTGHAYWVNPLEVSFIERDDAGSLITMNTGAKLIIKMDPSELAQAVGDRL